ncbi:MAG: hypothetical protein ABRQ26_00415 [Syntrophomonadaceae bacterium]
MSEKKKSRSGLILVILLVLGMAVIAFNLYRDPSLLQKIPVVKNFVKVKDQTAAPQTELEKLAQENDTLKKGLAQKEQELAKVKQQLAASPQTQLEAEVAKLNKELNDAKGQSGAKKASYKDMAKYFAEMNSKDAADILARLDSKDAIGILQEMNADAVASILQNMDRDKAVQISREMLVTAPSGG